MTTIRAAGVLGRPGADTVVIADGVITWVGAATDHPTEVDHHFPGGYVLPGLRDSHIHPVGLAATSTGLSVEAAADLDDVADLVRAHAAGLAPGAPVTGNRLDEEKLAGGRLPDGADLDRMVADRPLVLNRVCGHIAVANTAALRRAGISNSTADPPGGQIDRDDSGGPTGVLRETAIGLVTGALAGDIPSPSSHQIEAAVASLPALGITAITAMVSTGPAMWCGTESELDDFLVAAPALAVSSRVFTITDAVDGLETAAERIAGASGRVEWGGWKGFADGSLGGRTAALAAPYTDRPETTGTLRLDRGRDRPIAERALQLGGAVAVHAIGDRANREAVEFLGSLRNGGDEPGFLRLEHASLLAPDLLPIIARRGIVASVQPAFAASDAGWIRARVGRERAGWAYPWRSLQEAGVTMLGGSDAPVERPDPWAAMAAVIAHPVTPSESLSAADALAMFVSHDLAVGAPGDLVVVDRDPMTTADITATTPLGVFSGGERIHPPPA